MIIKVGGVRTPEEAEQLERLGADIIGVQLNDADFGEEGGVDAAQCGAIHNGLRSARLLVTCGRGGAASDVVVRQLGELGSPLVEVSPEAAWDAATRRVLGGRGILLLYSGLEAEHDTDPSWILSPLVDMEEPNAAYVQVELLPEVENSWQFLREECPKFPDELQVGDIEQLAREWPLLVSTDFSPANIADIVGTIPSIAGIALTLGAPKQGAHTFEFANVVEILQALQDDGARAGPLGLRAPQ